LSESHSLNRSRTNIGLGQSPTSPDWKNPRKFSANWLRIHIRQRGCLSGRLELARRQWPSPSWRFSALNFITSLPNNAMFPPSREIEFSSYGLAAETIALLQVIWQREAQDAPAPAFAQIVKLSRNNVRDALMSLETELLAV
jgi:hypothetical protein